MKKNTFNLLIWSALWVLSVGLLALGPQLIWDFNRLLTIFTVLINIGVGIGMIMANIRHLRGQDEMQQKIFLEASALTLGIGLVSAGSYQLWKDIQLITFEPAVSHLLILMTLTFMSKYLLELWRHR